VKFPTRSKSHVQETVAFKALQRCIPSEWIIRHVTERDYGVDCLIELVPSSGEMQGHLLAVQLKSAKRLAWKKQGAGEGRIATYRHVKTSTVNYWMGLPLPPVLVLYEECSESLFATPIRSQVRRDFPRLEASKTFSFKISSAFDLGTEDGCLALVLLYFREAAYSDFANSLLDLLYHGAEYAEFIANGMHADWFLTVPEEQLAHLIRLHRACRVVADFAGVKEEFRSIEYWIGQDRLDFKDSGEDMHQLTLAKALRSLGPAFVECLTTGRKLVTEIERDYWSRHDRFLVQFCDRCWTETEVARLSAMVRQACLW